MTGQRKMSEADGILQHIEPDPEVDSGSARRE